MEEREKNLISQALKIKGTVDALLKMAERVEFNLYNAKTEESAEEKKPRMSGLEDILSIANERLEKLMECIGRIDKKVGEVSSE